MAGRILVLDDEENYAQMLKDLLCEHNYRVDMATRPERAISQIEEIPYDLVISDYKMPVMDGADFLKKSRELYPNLPFILVSGLMNTPELVKVANMSVTLVMEKPLDSEEFLKHVARFSKPMTEEEKASLGDSADAVGASQISLPEEPRFLCASSGETKRALQQAWSIAESGSALFIMDVASGDAELAAKDISRWRGDQDLAMASFDLPESPDEAVAKIRAIADDPEQSKTIFIRLATDAQLRQAESLLERVQEELEAADSLLIVIALAKRPSAEMLSSSMKSRMTELPPLARRPLDVAGYVNRFLKIASERFGRSEAASLSPEAVYQILAFDWPRGYRQIQSVLSHAVETCDAEAPISLELIQELLGVKGAIAAPQERLSALMKRAQGNYFKAEINKHGISPAKLARDLELPQSIQSEEDLFGAPLVDEALGKL